MIRTNQSNSTVARGTENNNTIFCRDVVDGLRADMKHLQSKYFYDAMGDRLFQRIMNSPEYYLFNCELEIFSTRTADLASLLLQPGGSFDLIELGPGDCTKSGYLLQHLVKANADFTYVPIDISTSIIQYLETQLPQRIPGIKISSLEGEYSEMLAKAATISRNRKVILFLGSNLGNMTPEQALAFSRNIRSHLQKGDLALIGLDLKKDPNTVLAAYNDKEGITRQFNLNLLKRINRELKANFDISKFEHYPTYDPATGSCKSYLVSQEEQSVCFIAGNNLEVINFKKGEPIYMELSQKYTTDEIGRMAQQAGFSTAGFFYDSKGWFVDACWKAI
ncbi:dimethylhistidine N-methyltransferase [Niastella yeongjuensis]|uniref:Dimethylhistidine N-methyltransferase n=1 Tax=Niastella yeongjuensis TaxID=354355 RepID=A0A1V9E4D4_9BACT|nr:L-histidine N(alpha)-methyltransferase [Niastella yeongjuensis]OQP40775.1 dimethylhistidine N-methyltransferase [Niastella yeongjuensis]SEP02091.1 dimethylhistidine N-methyltransferase [Niastella yeongjuensis]